MADFILGRLKFHFKGDWVTATNAYIKDDVVRYGGNSFVAMANHTSSTNFETDLSSTKWKKMAQGKSGKALRQTTTYYKVDDVVQWGVQLSFVTPLTLHNQIYMTTLQNGLVSFQI